jgi:hypothetical protein
MSFGEVRQDDGSVCEKMCRSVAMDFMGAFATLLVHETMGADQL